MRSGLRKRWDDLYEWVEKKYRGIEYRKKAKVRNKRMHGGLDCKKEYKEIVVPYWKQFGRKPKIIWYKNYCAESKKVDPRYIPDDMWFEDILPYFSNIQFRRFGEDKCQHGIWFPDAKRPYTVCANIAGVFYDNEYNIITKEEAAKRCVEYKRFLIKPSIDSGEGRLIKFYDDEELTTDGMLKAFDEMGCNFLAQEVLCQHPAISELNASSLNTVRIVSFLFEGEVYILSSILRIGASNSRVDNVGAGGYACPIMPDGRLNKLAVNRKSEWVEENQNGIRFDSVVVPAYDKAVEMVKELHRKLAHFKIIGWDVGINAEAEPVLIEFNTNPGQNQYSCGPTFGDLTERVLEDVFINKTLKNSNN
jgi:hypothetical protein